LLNTERFAVTRESSNERGIEETRLNNLANVAKIAKLDEGIIFFRDKILLFPFGNNSGARLVGLLHLFPNGKIPTATTNLVLCKFIGDSLVVATIHSAPSTNISCCDAVPIERLERSADVVSGKCHYEMRVFVSTKLSYFVFKVCRDWL